MQRVTNCVLLHNNQLLLLQKPRRNWWSAPGGKMEQGESVWQSCVREFWEETGLKLVSPQLKGVFTFVIEDEGTVINEWMMFTFMAQSFHGELTEVTEEGILQWHPLATLDELEMAEGDYAIIEHCLHEEHMLFGTFRYTANMELLGYNLHSDVDDVRER